MIIHENTFMYTPTRNFTSEIHIGKTPKKNYLAENLIES